jgi:hypothetical protein
VTAKNDFKAFADEGGANVLPQALYEELEALGPGFPYGKLPSKDLNKVLRQATTIAAMFAQLAVDTLDEDVLDDGDADALKSQLRRMIVALGADAVGALFAVNNLSDVDDVAVARTNLQLGSAALADSGDFDAAGAAAAAQAAAEGNSDPAGSAATAQAVAIASNRSIPVDDGNANRNLVLADCWVRFIRMTLATANTVTMTLANLATMADGDEISGIQAGAGQTTLTPGGGVTFNATPGLKTRDRYSPWTIKRVDATHCDVFGDLAA